VMAVVVESPIVGCARSTPHGSGRLLGEVRFRRPGRRSLCGRVVDL
jgi:hypothetical protein